jgi:predicted helicase
MSDIQNYLNKIERAYTRGDATEHTHRPYLKALVESFQSGITATNEPKRIACGAPDYIITKGTIAQSEIPLGYIEAKDVGKDLDRLDKREKEQFERYREALPNLIYTDYLEFRWYVRGEHRTSVTLAEIGRDKKITLTANGGNELTELLENFLTIQAETVSTPKELAKRMASIARQIQVTIKRALETENTDDSDFDPLHDQMMSFRKVLLPDLKEEQFADLYAQTIAYGLFSARCNSHTPPFTRLSAGQSVPRTNPFLRQLFDNIAGINLDKRITWAVDNLAELLNRTNIEEILQDFGKRTRQEDPVVHFYETFLAEYNPKLRETRGVYYTPEPVVSYIVRSVDKILQTNFGLSKGLADSSKIKIKQGETEIESHKLLILDPATGTGTFLYSVIKQIAKRFEKNKGMWDGYVSEHLLPRIFGFELLVAPYSVAHLKLGLLLEETGYKFQSNERLRVFLTNTLEEVDRLSDASGLTRWLNDEADFASKIKQDAPVMVVLGNPPYSGHSANTGEWIKQLLHGVDTHTGKLTENYFEVDGQPLGEANPKYLNDDYVKFIRFAQWRIDQTGYGVLAFVTNHGYLDNPTFRGMRQSLMKSFDEIYVLDLHGNSKKKERSPDNSKDENVFDIQQGVSIGIFVKKQAKTEDQNPKPDAKVFHKHLYGVREIWTENVNNEKELTGGKYQWLSQNDISTTEWLEIKPQSTFYLFTPQNTDLFSEFEKGWKITDIMPSNSTGIKTHRDHFVIDFDKSELQKRIKDFCDLTISDSEISKKYNLSDTDSFKLSRSRKALKESKEINKSFTKILYRPFDTREYFHNELLVDRARTEIMQHLLIEQKNIALLLPRQLPSEFKHVLASRTVVSTNTLATAGRFGAGNVFPLYLYPPERRGLFDEESSARKPNFSDEFIKDFSAKLKLEFVSDGKGDLVKTFAPEDVFNYAYAVFHSPTYRARYAEFLKIDFPRLPLTSNYLLFFALARFGEQLVKLHLLEKDIESDVTFPEKGSNEVELVKYENEKVWINRTQYFENIPENVWNFHIGGYQVLQKWLKDRKGRPLSFDDLEHYETVVSALLQTIELMIAVDEAIEENGSFPIE